MFVWLRTLSADELCTAYDCALRSLNAVHMALLEAGRGAEPISRIRAQPDALSREYIAAMNCFMAITDECRKRIRHQARVTPQA
jgi:hypothetical protein